MRPQQPRRLTVAIAVLLAAGAACATGPRQVRLDLVVRSSCGFAPQNYDTSCVAAIDVRLVDPSGAVLASQCTPVRDRYANLEALVSSTNLLPVLKNVSAPSRATVELRAYHAFDKAPCTNLSDADLMLWGSSEPVDLSQQNLQLVTVQLECRPGCDCQSFDADPSHCPTQLSPGACAPPDKLLCRKSCDAPCYGGAVTCSGGMCTPTAGGLCASCSSSADCTSGLCVHNTTRDEYFCAERCPPAQGSAACPAYMSCKRLATGDAFEAVP